MLVLAASVAVPGTSASESPEATTAGDPTISDVATLNVTETTVDVTWTVSAPATGQVEYGPTPDYGQLSTLEPSFDYQTHVQRLSGLAPGTLHHFRVMSQDQAGRWVVSEGHTFQTAGGGATTAYPTPAPIRSPATTPVPGPSAEPSPTPAPDPSPTPVPQPAPTSFPAPEELLITDVAAIDVTETRARITWTVSAPATGQVEYGPTPAYGQHTTLETSFDYRTHVQHVSGLVPGTEYHFRVTSSDAAGRTVTSDDQTFVTLGAAQPVAPVGVYGPGIAADSKANFGIGPSGLISHRFVASTAAPLQSVRWPQRFGAGGYSGGTGGTIRITIQEDAGGIPSGTPLALASYQPTPADLSLQGSRYYAQPFENPPSLVPGRTYHVVFENVDPAPTSNWISVNEMFVYDGGSIDQPGLPETVAVLRRPVGGAWQVQPHFTPVMDLRYADGTHDGQGYIEPMFGHYGVVDGDAQVRERFTPTEQREVTGAFVRVKRVAGSAPLVLQLEHAGTVLASVTVAEAAAIPASPLPTEQTLDGARWVGGSFPSPVRLEPGTTYDLRLTTSAGTTYVAVPIRAGTDGGGTGIEHAMWSRVFADGRAQQSSDAGWGWRDLYPWSPANLQFYLELGPGG